MAKLMSKSELIQKIADQQSNGLTRKHIKGVIESLVSVGHKELKKTGASPDLDSRNLLSSRSPPQTTYWHQSFYKGTHNIQGKAS